MGFKTLAIQKRSSEVWEVLGAVKTQFGKFSNLLEKTQRQLKTVAGTIEEATKKTKTIEGKLRKVQQLPESLSIKVLKGVEELENSQEDAEGIEKTSISETQEDFSDKEIRSEDLPF